MQQRITLSMLIIVYRNETTIQQHPNNVDDPDPQSDKLKQQYHTTLALISQPNWIQQNLSKITINILYTNLTRNSTLIDLIAQCTEN